MMELDIVTFGQVKEKYMVELINDYKKRISKFAKINFIELKDEPLRDSVNRVLELEGAKLEEVLKNAKYVVVLDIDGKNITSEQLASKLDEIFTYNSNKITFVIGGSYGILQSLKDKCNFKLSFSKMTFPHQFMKGILLEQIYRSFKILNNESYHK
ncbi:MAG: 23S rRNA (pseudouridine(1915)-N(3))-methyltransferase RlmH [bacterium]